MISEVKPSAITIPSTFGRTRTVLVTGFCAAVAVAVVLDPPTPHWARHEPSLAVYLAVGALVAALLVYRGWRTGVRFDGRGVTICYFFWTRRLSWHEVSRFADGCTAGLGEISRRVWALDVALHDGRVVTVKATARDSCRSAAPKVLTAVLLAAQCYGVQAALTGVGPKRRPRRSAEENPSASASSQEAGGIVKTEWAASADFSTTRLRPGYEMEEVDAFLEAIRQTFRGIREPPLTADDIRKSQFSTTRLRPGYDEEEVDAYLDAVELGLAAMTRAELPADPELYPDLGGTPGSRQREDTGWSPLLRVDSATGGPEGAKAPAAVWTPLPGSEQQWHDATAKAGQRNILVLIGAGLAVLTAVIVGIALANAPTSSTSSSASRSAALSRSSASPSTPSTFQAPSYELQAGDCLVGSDVGLGTSSPWPDYVTVVPCTQQHIAEVFFAGDAWPESQAYPGDNAIDSQAENRCDAAFNEYDGITSDNSIFTYDYVTPSGGEDWAAGDRWLMCVAYESTSEYPGGAPVNYSIKGTNQ